MEQIRNKEYGGERPLFATHDLQLEDVTGSSSNLVVSFSPLI